MDVQDEKKVFMLKTHDDTNKEDFKRNKRLAAGSAAKRPDSTKEGVYKQYNDFKSKGILSTCKWPDPTSSNTITHSAGRVHDASDYIFRRGVDHSSGLGGEYKFSNSTCIAANAGYYIFNGKMCYLHSDGNAVLLNSEGATPCTCGRSHQV